MVTACINQALMYTTCISAVSAEQKNRPENRMMLAATPSRTHPSMLFEKMALTIKLCRLSSQSLLKNKGYLCIAARCASHGPLPWNFLWEPGTYSEKDHDEIAEKYHLHPKDYKPYPEDKYMGDYPDLPMIGPGAKDPYYPYDMPTFKKNYHETVHYQFGIMTEAHFDCGKVHRIDLGVGTLIFLGFITGLAVIYVALEPYYVFQPVLEKQYPYTGKTYYTFEPKEKKI